MIRPGTAFVCLLAAASPAAAEAPLDYNLDVRPLLSDRCFKCHGPDPVARRGKFRLDVREDALTAREGIVRLRLGRPDESELMVRILSPHSDEVMPPPGEGGRPLSPAEQAILRRWITEGAPYAPHWSLVPPRAAPPPPVRDVAWPVQDLDRFILARHLAERGVRFIQLYHRGWDQHYNLPSDLRLQAGDVDQPGAALVRDLKQRGLLEDTLVVWGGEFGRTTYSQGRLEVVNYGRDHYGGCFTLWLAGGGVKPGHIHGETDEFCYQVTRDPVHVHDLNATLLHQLGLDHTRLTYRFQGRDYRLTDVHGRVIQPILA